MTAFFKRSNSTRRSRTWRRCPSVELLETRQLLTTFTVGNTNDGGPSSLRRAIALSNADTAQTNLITFDLGTSGLQTINLLSALPAITQSVTIQGTTDSSGNPLVELSGAGAGSGTDGLLVEADDTTVQGLIIVQFSQDGIYVSASHDVITNNYIGADSTGTSALGNGRQGVLVNGSNDTIGGSTAGSGNVIAGNGNDGLQIAGSGATGDVVQENMIGIGANGNSSSNYSNGRFGILVNFQASHNLIGTNGDGVNDVLERNLISGNSSWGLEISDPGTNSNVVAGNFIGTYGGGQHAHPNGGGGVLIQDGATANLVGTDGVSVVNADEGNLISGNNGAAGIMISDSGTNSNVVAGNLIGVDITGANVVANVNNGVWITGGAQSNRIGKSAGDLGAAAEPNVISGNNSSGVSISGAGTNFNMVSGNWIGVNSADSFTVGNGVDGVTIFRGAQSNTIGGSVALANSIVNNIGNGVGVYGTATTGNTIRFNLIRKNQGLGIDLGGDGVTPNHVPAATSGPNSLENYPIITSAGSGTTTTVGVSFVSLPSSTYTLDFYVSPVSDPSGYGEGNGWLGSVSVTTDSNGQINGPTTFNLPAETLAGRWITATATDQAGDTSEFSNAWHLPTLSNQVSVTPSLSSPVYGQSLTFTTNVSSPPRHDGLGAPTGTIQYQIDGSPFGPIVALVKGVATSIDTGVLSAGVHTISAAYSGDAFYTSFTETLSQTVTPAPLSITADNKSKVYGAADPALTYTVTGLLNGDASSVISGITLTTTTGAAATAGSHAITVAGGTAANYAVTDFSGTLTVSKAPLTVTADNKSKMYGAADPILTYTPSGTLYYGDSYSVISGVTLTTTTGAATTAGTHAIVITGGTATNYVINDVGGTLTVTPPPLVTVTKVQIEPVHLKKGKIATDIVVIFSGAVDIVGGKYLRNYNLYAPGKGKKSNTYNKPIKLTSAVYGGTAQEVTLRLNGKLALKPPPQLRITASGIFDSIGRPLDGNRDGQPGGDYIELLTPAGAQP